MAGKNFTLDSGVHSLALCGEFLLVGTRMSLYLIDLEKERRIRVKLSEEEGNGETFTCIKVLEDKGLVLIGSVTGYFILFEVRKLKKVISEYRSLPKEGKEVEVPIDTLAYHVNQLNKSVSTIEAVTCGQGLLFLVGHHNGEITVLGNNDSKSPVLFVPEPVTCLRYSSGYVYYSLASGELKKVPALRMGINNEQSAQAAKLMIQQTRFYKSRSLIVSFEIITGCLSNKKIAKPEHRFEAALVTLDGYFQVISNSMECERSIRLTHSPVLSVVFERDPLAPWGVKTLAADETGVVHNHEGEVVMEGRLKETSALSVDARRMAVGSFSKGVWVVRRSGSLNIA